MQGVAKFIAIIIAAALAACEKHREENTDSAAYNHPLNEKGAPVRNPPPEPLKGAPAGSEPAQQPANR
jgi:hypothetical protein